MILRVRGKVQSTKIRMFLDLFINKNLKFQYWIFYNFEQVIILDYIRFFTYLHI
jgi:hypothetical protein